MFNRYIINFVLLFKAVFERFGVDSNQLRIILTTKMKMDDRRPNVYNQQRQKQKKEVNHSSWLTMFFLGITGLFFTALLVIAKQPFVGHTIYFSALISLGRSLTKRIKNQSGSEAISSLFVTTI